MTATPNGVHGATGSGGLAGLGTDELRAAVRAVLREVLPEAMTRAGAATPPHEALPGGPVTVHRDADLDALVRQIAALCADPDVRAALQAGRHRFRLATGQAAVGAITAGATPAAGVLQVDRGAVTERTVLKAAGQNARLRLGKRAVLTPLARDKARSLGVPIEREG